MPSQRKKAARSTETRRRLRVRPAYIVLLAVMALFALSFVRNMREVRSLEAQQAALQAQNHSIAQSNDSMQHAIHYYKTTAYAREAARSMFGYTLPGDVPVVPQRFRHPKVEVRAAPPRPRLPTPPTWKQWWNSFLGSPS